MNIYVMRHGETDWNIDKKIQGSTDVELNATGIKQARDLANRLKKEGTSIKKIYSSTKVRASRTAKEISEITGIPYTTIDGFEEMCLGVWEGSRWGEVKELYPEEYRIWCNNIRYTRIPGGESYQDVAERAFETLDRIISETNDDVLIVTHGVVTYLIRSLVENVQFDKMNKAFNIGNAVPIRFTLEDILDAKKRLFPKGYQKPKVASKSDVHDNKESDVHDINEYVYKNKDKENGKMIYFQSDYSIGAHPKVMEALMNTNMEHTTGYGLDEHCINAANMIKKMIGNENCAVHMMVGGTPCNITLISSALRPYESVIACRTGHIYSHETGGVEANGHRVVTVDGVNGKMQPYMIDEALEEYEDEHTAMPRMVYISQPTECGSIYSEAELVAIYNKCKEKNLYLYVDGARLGTALTSEENDLSLQELAANCDAFYIGGTKNGALFGEALVLINPELDDHFRFMIKQNCGMLAKGRLLGVQFEALLEGGGNSIFFKMAAHENAMAKVLREALKAMGISFYSDSPTNQIFPILPVKTVEELEKNFMFHRWAPERDGMIPVRFVTSWATTEEEVKELIDAVKQLVNA